MKDRISVRIQILDDDAAICRRLESWLIEDGYCVDCYTSADEAMLAVVDRAYDIAVVDLRLPDHDGCAVVAAIQSSSPKTRIIVMAAFPKPEEAAKVLASGARNLLSKPIHRADLLAAVSQQVCEIGVGWRTEDTFNAALGARLKELRVAAGRTQHEIASQALITSAQLSQIERGRCATSTWTLARICWALRVPLSDIFPEGGISSVPAQPAAAEQIGA